MAMGLLMAGYYMSGARPDVSRAGDAFTQQHPSYLPASSAEAALSAPLILQAN